MAEHLQEHPPQALEFPVKHRDHDFVREDPWHWLREREDPRVLAHLEAENAYTEAVMAAAGDLPEKLYAELVGRIEESNVSAPYPKGGYLYQSRIDKGQNYRMYFRKPKDGEADWSLYFDSNREAAGLAYFDLGFLDVSPDERLLAYAVDSVGEESFRLKFRDLASGHDLPESFEAVSADGEWDATGALFYFVGEDDSKRPYQIFRYRIGTAPEEAELVYEEPDPLFYTGIYKSQDGRFLFICSESKETSEIRYLDATDPDGDFQVLFPRREGIQYWVDHQDGEWLVRSDEEAPDYKLLALPVGSTDLGQARVLVPPREGV
ncbi:MAG TPA: hypothetical protein VK995_01185, partial [Oceanipulchritudo sp.]|nr:hypothetical protein [Oceanipulchritudo sp.]